MFCFRNQTHSIRLLDLKIRTKFMIDLSRRRREERIQRCFFFFFLMKQRKSVKKRKEKKVLMIDFCLCCSKHIYRETLTISKKGNSQNNKNFFFFIPIHACFIIFPNYNGQLVLEALSFLTTVSWSLLTTTVSWSFQILHDYVTQILHFSVR